MKFPLRWPARLALLFVFVASTIGCDQTTKMIATRTLPNRPPISFLGDTVRLQYALNPGGFLSLGSGLPDPWRFWYFSVASACMMLVFAGLILARWRTMNPAAFFALALVFSGGVGNLLDRWFQNGLVTDFLNLGIGPLRTGIFNVADMALCLGALLLVCQCRDRQPSIPTTEPSPAP